MSREHSPDHDHGTRAPTCDGILLPEDQKVADDVLDSRHYTPVFGGVSVIGSSFGRPTLCRGPSQASGPTDQSP